MSRFFSLLLILGICNAPISTVAHANEHNRPGLFSNNPALVVTSDETGCPMGYTAGSQHMSPGNAAVLISVVADARIRCIEATANAAAKITLANAKATSEILRADASAEAIRTASTYSEPVNVVGMAATGTAANISAGGYGPGWAGQGAMDLAMLKYLNPGAPPPMPQATTVTDEAASTEEPEEAAPELTPEERLKAAEANARAAMKRAGIK